MAEQHLDITTEDGAMNTFIVYPDGRGPFPAVLFLMDAPGKREELHDMARRLSGSGYYVVLPNLYYRRSRDYYLKERTPEAMAPMFEHMNATTNAMAVRDVGAMLKFIDTQPDALVEKSRVGAVGYCMSGPFVMHAAAAYPDRIKSIASIHGAQMVTDKPDSPHLTAPHIQCQAYFACAEIDKWAPPAEIAVLEKALKEAGTPYQLEWYPGAQHGFVFPQRTGIYDEASAEQHWIRILDLFDRTLKRPV